MASENRVRNNLRKLLDSDANSRLEAEDLQGLKERVGASTMKTTCFQQMLADMKHVRKIRGFSLKGEELYIQG